VAGDAPFGLLAHDTSADPLFGQGQAARIGRFTEL
jgi:hypothetical protein